MRQPTYTESGDDRKLTEAVRLRLARDICHSFETRRYRSLHRNSLRRNHKIHPAAAICVGIAIACGVTALCLVILY